MSEQSESDMGREFRVGDMVRFVDVHHAHNSDLQKHEGAVGEITTVGHGHDNKLLVEFNDSPFQRYRISPGRVELVNRSNNTDTDQS